jgi:hypothetical protein
MRGVHRFGLDFALRLLGGGLDPAGGGESGDGEIGVEGARTKAEGVGTGDDRALAKAIERFHAIIKSEPIQRGDAKQCAVANGRLFVGGKNGGRGGCSGLEGHGRVLAGIVPLALMRIVADKKNAFAGFEPGMRVLHQNGARDGRSAGHVAMHRAIFEDDGGEPVALGNREGGIGVDL